MRCESEMARDVLQFVRLHLVSERAPISQHLAFQGLCLYSSNPLHLTADGAVPACTIC